MTRLPTAPAAALALVACSTPAPPPARTPAPQAPVPVASATPAPEPAPRFKETQMGTDDPVRLIAYDRGGVWAAFCQVRKDTDDDGYVAEGDRWVPYLARGKGDGEPLADFIAFSPTGDHVVVEKATPGDRVRSLAWVLRDMRSGKERPVAGLAPTIDGSDLAAIGAVAFSDDGARMAFRADWKDGKGKLTHILHAMDLTTGKVTRVKAFDQPVLGVSFVSPAWLRAWLPRRSPLRTTEPEPARRAAQGPCELGARRGASFETPRGLPPFSRYRPHAVSVFTGDQVPGLASTATGPHLLVDDPKHPSVHDAKAGQQALKVPTGCRIVGDDSPKFLLRCDDAPTFRLLEGSDVRPLKGNLPMKGKALHGGAPVRLDWFGSPGGAQAILDWKAEKVLPQPAARRYCDVHGARVLYSTPRSGAPATMIWDVDANEERRVSSHRCSGYQNDRYAMLGNELFDWTPAAVVGTFEHLCGTVCSPFRSPRIIDLSAGGTFLAYANTPAWDQERRKRAILRYGYEEIDDVKYGPLRWVGPAPLEETPTPAPLP